MVLIIVSQSSTVVEAHGIAGVEAGTGYFKGLQWDAAQCLHLCSA